MEQHKSERGTYRPWSMGRGLRGMNYGVLSVHSSIRRLEEVLQQPCWARGTSVKGRVDCFVRVVIELEGRNIFGAWTFSVLREAESAETRLTLGVEGKLQHKMKDSF